MTKLIDLAKSVTQKAQDSEAARIALEEAVAREELSRAQSDAVQWAQEQMVTCRNTILKEAHLANNKAEIAIANYEEKISVRTDLRADALSKLLKAEGFVVEQHVLLNGPCGSDSWFDTTVYSTILDVSW